MTAMADDARRRRAAALHYGGRGAPRVVASGAGFVAERIAAVAREAGVPIRRDPALADALGALELDREIPEELFRAVAEVLAWAYSLDLAARGEHS